MLCYQHLELQEHYNHKKKMKVVRNLLISSTEPTDTNVGWLKPLPDGNFKLFFNNGGWTPILIDITIESVGQLAFQYVGDVPDIVIS